MLQNTKMSENCERNKCITIKLRENDHDYSRSLHTSDLCEKVIHEPIIVMKVCNSSVRYFRQNGFHLYDLIYLCNRQYLFVNSVPEFEIYDEKITNEIDINWNNSDGSDDALEHSLNWFNYYPESKLVDCSMDN
jgi:hypothetical protein